MKVLQIRELVFEVSPSLFPGVCTVLDQLIWVRLCALEKVPRLDALSVPPTIVDNDSTNLLKH